MDGDRNAPGGGRPGFLSLPHRPPKPRQTGITHVIDHGQPLVLVEGFLRSAGASVDIVKLGWGTAYITQDLDDKLALYAEHGIPVVLGGTFFEVCLAHGKLDQWRRWIDRLGLSHVEVSDGTVAMPHEVKLEHIRRLSGDLTVLSEVGSKDAENLIAPYRWVQLIQAEIEAGAWKVITEARESGTAGIFRPDGELRTGLIDEIVHQVEVDRLVFEAPRKAQQLWFIRAFGPNVNLGNIPPDEVIALETLRLGLRADTLLQLLPADAPRTLS